MANHNPIIDNASKFPRVMANAIKARPTMLCDETPEVVKEVARTLVRKGLRADVLELADSAGLDACRREIVRQACFNHGTVH